MLLLFSFFVSHVYHYYTRTISKPNEVYACGFFFTNTSSSFSLLRLLPLLFLFVALNWIDDKYTLYLSFFETHADLGFICKSMEGYGFDCFWVQFAFLTWQHTHTFSLKAVSLPPSPLFSLLSAFFLSSSFYLLLSIVWMSVKHTHTHTFSFIIQM